MDHTEPIQSRSGLNDSGALRAHVQPNSDDLPLVASLLLSSNGLQPNSDGLPLVVSLSRSFIWGLGLCGHRSSSLMPASWVLRRPNIGRPETEHAQPVHEFTFSGIWNRVLFRSRDVMAVMAFWGAHQALDRGRDLRTPVRHLDTCWTPAGHLDTCWTPVGVRCSDPARWQWTSLPRWRQQGSSASTRGVQWQSREPYAWLVKKHRFSSLVHAIR